MKEDDVEIDGDELAKRIEALAELFGEEKPRFNYSDPKLELHSLGEDACRKLHAAFGGELTAKAVLDPSIEGCPVFYTAWNGYVKAMYVRTTGATRKATKKEIAAEMQRLVQRVEACCPPTD